MNHKFWAFLVVIVFGLLGTLSAHSFIPLLIALVGSWLLDRSI